MDHTCHDCRNAQRLNMEQIARFLKSDMTMTEFINMPYEDEMASHMRTLMQRCTRRKEGQARFPSTR